MSIIVPPSKLAPDSMVGVSVIVDRYYSASKKVAALVSIVVMARGCFDDTKGAVLVKNLAAKEPSALGLDSYYKQYYLCLAAAAATIKWTEAEKGVIITNHSLSVCLLLSHCPCHFNGSFDHMSIDATSVQNLELIEPLHSNLWGTSNKKKVSSICLRQQERQGDVMAMGDILGVICKLQFHELGIVSLTRLLRANLLQPLKDIETINARLDCLDELMSNEQLFFGLSQVLRKFPKETGKEINCRRPKITNKVLKDAKSFLLSNIYNSICEMKICTHQTKLKTSFRIGEVIDEDVVHARVPFIARTQQCFAVKAGIDGLLDVARRTFCDTSEAIHKLTNKYREEFNLPNLKLPFNSRQGFYFSVPHKDVQGKLPSKFIQMVAWLLMHHNCFDIFVDHLGHGGLLEDLHPGSCMNLQDELRASGVDPKGESPTPKSLNVRNKSAAAECCVRTEICLEALNESIREDVSVLTLLAEVLCLLDMIVNSFAHLISTKPVDQYVRPEFTDSGPLAIDAGRHPILESIHNDFVPNNIFLSEASNVVIVYGSKHTGIQVNVDILDKIWFCPFRSGKSTYLQQVCLIIVLAQIGCYIPARFSTIRVVDRIFTRMGAVDNLESNSSTV
ncbi:DNA mismatch repair protein MSH4 [Bienertia sinuspersici]